MSVGLPSVHVCVPLLSVTIRYLFSFLRIFLDGSIGSLPWLGGGVPRPYRPETLTLCYAKRVTSVNHETIPSAVCDYVTGHVINPV